MNPDVLYELFQQTEPFINDQRHTLQVGLGFVGKNWIRIFGHGSIQIFIKQLPPCYYR